MSRATRGCTRGAHLVLEKRRRQQLLVGRRLLLAAPATRARDQVQTHTRAKAHTRTRASGGSRGMSQPATHARALRRKQWKAQAKTQWKSSCTHTRLPYLLLGAAFEAGKRACAPCWALLLASLGGQTSSLEPTRAASPRTPLISPPHALVLGALEHALGCWALLHTPLALGASQHAPWCFTRLWSWALPHMPLVAPMPDKGRGMAVRPCALLCLGVGACATFVGAHS